MFLNMYFHNTDVNRFGCVCVLCVWACGGIGICIHVLYANAQAVREARMPQGVLRAMSLARDLHERKRQSRGCCCSCFAVPPPNRSRFTNLFFFFASSHTIFSTYFSDC